MARRPRSLGPRVGRQCRTGSRSIFSRSTISSRSTEHVRSRQRRANRARRSSRRPRNRLPPPGRRPARCATARRLRRPGRAASARCRKRAVAAGGAGRCSSSSRPATSSARAASPVNAWASATRARAKRGKDIGPGFVQLGRRFLEGSYPVRTRAAAHRKPREQHVDERHRLSLAGRAPHAASTLQVRLGLVEPPLVGQDLSHVAVASARDRPVGRRGHCTPRLARRVRRPRPSGHRSRRTSRGCSARRTRARDRRAAHRARAPAGSESPPRARPDSINAQSSAQ